MNGLVSAYLRFRAVRSEYVWRGTVEGGIAADVDYFDHGVQANVCNYCDAVKWASESAHCRLYIAWTVHDPWFRLFD